MKGCGLLAPQKHGSQTLTDEVKKKRKEKISSLKKLAYALLLFHNVA